jgi:hypothetical protein
VVEDRREHVFAREIRAEYRGFQIVVQNSWANGFIPALVSEGFEGARKALGDETRLLIDGKVVDSTKDWILWPTTAPLLQSFLNDENDKYIVTVHARASWLKNLLKLCVDGKRIAGDEF